MSAMGIKAGRAFVEIGTDNNPLSRGLSNAQKKLAGFGKSMQSTGKQMAMAGAVMAAPLAISTKTMMGYEQQMARVRALTGANDADFKKLTDEAKRLGIETVFSADQAAQAMSFFALAGYDVNKILAATGPTLNLASAGQLDMAQAADITAKIMAGMGMEANQLGRAVDVLTKGMTTANTDLVQLGEAMKYVGPVAKNANQSLEQTVAVIQMLSNAGIQAEMAGTTLRGVLLTLTSPSAEAEEELKALGVRVLDVKGQVRPLADIIDDLNNGMKGMGGGQKLSILGKIFDARQAAGAAELLSQGGGKLRQMTAALQGSAGVAERISKIQLDTVQGDVTMLTSSLEGLQIAIGEALAKAIRTALQYSTQLVNSLITWVGQNQGLVMGILYGVGALLGLGAAMWMVGAATAGLAKVFAILSTAVGIVVTVFKILWVVIAALFTPIGAIAGALVALGAYFLYASGTGAQALDWLGKKFGTLKEEGMAAWQGIADALASGDIGLAAKILWQTLKMWWAKGVNWLMPYWLEFKKWFLEIAYGAFYGFKAAWETVGHAITVAWIESVAWLGSIWSKFTAFCAKAWDNTATFFANRWADLRGLVDKDFDANRAKNYNNAQSQQNHAFINTNRDNELGRIEKDRAAKREKETREYQAGLNVIVGEYDAAMKSVTQGNAKKSEQAGKDLADARAEWKKSLDDAKRGRAEKDAKDQGPGKTAAPGGPVNAFQKQLEMMDGMMEAQKKTIGVRGTFNAMEAAGLGAGGAADRLVKAGEATATNTKKILDQMKQQQGQEFE